ncbi:hypothetical protein K438DRAFT_1782366 [Mycena galopus ATCC 62051]|nr:hypothetical protein K438DRAFT_1782366 [Mycena galopus ATCC 62051]
MFNRDADDIKRAHNATKDPAVQAARVAMGVNQDPSLEKTLQWLRWSLHWLGAEKCKARTTIDRVLELSIRASLRELPRVVQVVPRKAHGKTGICILSDVSPAKQRETFLFQRSQVYNVLGWTGQIRLDSLKLIRAWRAWGEATRRRPGFPQFDTCLCSLAAGSQENGDSGLNDCVGSKSEEYLMRSRPAFPPPSS